MLGLSLETFTFLHIAISLIAIAAGFIVVGGFLTGRQLAGATFAFLMMTIATNATGLLFPFSTFLPSHAVALISLVILAVAGFAHYGRRQHGAWRNIYVFTAVAALYLNVFVLIVQTFTKNPALAAIAPTQSEPPFLIAQGLTLVGFLILGFLSVRRLGAP